MEQARSIHVLACLTALMVLLFIGHPQAEGEPAQLSTPTATALDPNDIHYLGAFRLPEDGEGNEDSFAYSGEALAFSPGGDGGQGSLFLTGHAWHTYVAEISIPEPGQSQAVEDLPQARTLQPFRNIRGNLFDRWDLELPRVGLEVLGDRLYFCWGEHFEQDYRWGTHGVRSLDLSQPPGKAVCRIQTEAWTYATNGYLFSIPASWADRHLPGFDLASGSLRGSWSGMGPSLFAFKSGDVQQAEMDEQIPAIPLLLYDTEIYDKKAARLVDYSEADDIAGAVWMEGTGGSAVIFGATHSYGDSWYGYPNGVVASTVDEQGKLVYAPVPDPPNDQRGWYDSDFRPVFMFYDPQHLARVASGEQKANQLQPYAILDLSQYMRHEKHISDVVLLGDLAYDPARGRLYVMEPIADGTRPIIHVFALNSAP